MASSDCFATAKRQAFQLRSYKEVQSNPEVLVNALKMNHQFEYKLSNKTKMKIDLFLALGEAKQEISIKESKSQFPLGYGVFNYSNYPKLLIFMLKNH